MNVRQALKQKTKLISEIKELQSIVKTYNSRNEGTPERYNIAELLTELKEKQAELVALKTQIHKANLPVYDKIFKMAELKSFITFLKNVPTEEGLVPGRYGGDSTKKVASLNSVQIRDLVKHIEKLIEELQEELDVHNGTTQI